MGRIQLKAEERNETGKKDSKRLRKTGFIPGVVYKEGKKTVHLRLFERDLADALRTKAGENVLIDLKIGKTAKSKGHDRVVIVKEVQNHPIKEEIMHVDFQEISLTEKLTVNVPIVAKGEAEGAVKDEGVLEHIMWELKVECLPADIPEKIEVDVTPLKIGDRILIKDLEVSPAVKILEDPEQAVIAVEMPRAEEPEPTAEEEITEPELIREKKEKEEAESEEASPGAEKKAAPGESKGPASGEGGGKEKK